ncbi:MAG: SRPBCC family protein, partial [Pseudomonadota bacterium]|nr:SRPBCC family protein [Pseudomonadota bacterium]
AYPDSFDRSELGLMQVPRFEQYKGFWFVCFDRSAPSLDTYLSGAKEYIDLVVDQSQSQEMEIVTGVQEYDVEANWKLLVENSFDDYHLHSTHSTWLEYMKDAGVNVKIPRGKGLLLPKRGVGKNLGNGHAAIDSQNFRGRPVAAWISIYGEKAKSLVEAAKRELIERLGEERAERVANTNRNLFVFPNLMINDGSSVTVRTFWPAEVDRMEVTAWALGPVEESPEMRKVRLDAFLTFYGPGGFATPDDVEALMQVQRGIAETVNEVPWSVMTRGIAKDGEQLNSDELHLRTFWRRWNELMTGNMLSAAE